MKVIYKLKEWYTLKEASERLSERFSEEITVENILEFLSTDKIDLSWYLSHDAAIKCEYYHKPTIIDGEKKAENNPYRDSNSKSVVFLSGYYRFSVNYNLELKDFYRQAIKHFEHYQTVENFEYVNVPFNEFVVTYEDQKKWLLMKPLSKDQLTKNEITKNVPWNSLERYSTNYDWPKFSELVITKQEIERFENSVTKIQNLDITSKERNTLLKIILGMTLTNYEYNPLASRNSTAREIAGDLALHGIKVDDDTIRKWLNEAKEQLPDDWKPEL